MTLSLVPEKIGVVELSVTSTNHAGRLTYSRQP